jgi:hypothetical protein
MPIPHSWDEETGFVFRCSTEFNDYFCKNYHQELQFQRTLMHDMAEETCKPWVDPFKPTFDPLKYLELKQLYEKVTMNIAVFWEVEQRHWIKTKGKP